MVSASVSSAGAFDTASSLTVPVTSSPRSSYWLSFTHGVHTHTPIPTHRHTQTDTQIHTKIHIDTHRLKHTQSLALNVNFTTIGNVNPNAKIKKYVLLFTKISRE